MIDCPALHERFPDKGYPYGNLVPAKIKMLRTVRSDLFILIKTSPPALAGQTYDAWVNSYGAVSAVFDDGRRLGLKPGEFEVIEWHEVAA